MTRLSSLDLEQLLVRARGEMFDPGDARLPAPPMLMFHRITHIAVDGGAYNKGVVQAELDIRPDLWFFGCHFEDDPVMPGCLGLDAMWQLAGFFLPWLGERNAWSASSTCLPRSIATGCSKRCWRVSGKP